MHAGNRATSNEPTDCQKEPSPSLTSAAQGRSNLTRTRPASLGPEAAPAPLPCPLMGNTVSSPACNATSLTCAVGEPQEICEYGTPCDWAPPPARAGCWSRVTSCACSPALYSGEATSNMQWLVHTVQDRNTVIAGPIMLWALTVVIVAYLGLRKLETAFGISRKGRWSSSSFPSSLLLPRPVLLAWTCACAAITLIMAAFTACAPADVWGSCPQANVCVYHQMFCESTRHASAVRHPANAWSNLPYIYTAFGIFAMSAHEAGHFSPFTSRIHDSFRPAAYKDLIVRPFQVLDLMFGIVLLAMSFFSFVWHSSNCTSIHFVDVGL